MVIEIKKIARSLKISVPDLITRSVGKRLYTKVNKLLQKANAGEVIVLDYAGIQVMDPSCIDEFLVKLMRDVREEGKEFFLRLKNITNIIELNIASVLDSYKEFSDMRMGIITEEINSDRHYCIGPLEQDEHEIIEFLKINKVSSLDNIAAYMKLETGIMKTKLHTMYHMRLVRREENVSREGYMSV